MNVRKIVKKITALGVGATMLGATIFGAAAADLSDFPKPLFVDANTGNVGSLFVLGESAKSIDTLGMNAIVAAVQTAAVKKVPLTTSQSTTVSVEGGVDLNSGTKEIYLGKALNSQTTTVTSDDLSLLSDDTFNLDDGSSVTYEQTILVGSADFTYEKNNGADIKDPMLVLKGKKDATDSEKYYYAYKVNFDEPINITDDTYVTGQKITLFGKEYTISSKSTTSELVLLGGSAETTLQVGETKEVSFNDETYTIELLGVASGGSKASIKVNGEFKEVTEGNTYNIAGVDVYADSVAEFSGTENAGIVTLQLGADELHLKNGKKVYKGSSNTDPVYGTYVTMTLGSTGDLSNFVVYISGSKDDAYESGSDAYILSDSSKTDDVYGAVSLDFTSVNYDLDSDSRKEVSIDSNGKYDLTASFDVKGNSASIKFAHIGSTSGNLFLADSSNYTIHVVEGESLKENEYFFLNKGDYQHFVQLTNINVDGTNSEVEFEDMVTGTTYTVSSWDQVSSVAADGGGKFNATKTIDGVDYYVQLIDGSTDTVKVTVGSNAGYGDAGDDTQVFQYLEPISGSNFRIGFFDDVTYTVANGTTYKFLLPTSDSAQSVVVNEDNGLSQNITVGGIEYNFLYDNSTTLTITPIVDSNLVSNPAVFLREDDDEANNNEVVVLTTKDSGTNNYAETDTPLFSNKIGSANFDDADYTGYLDYFGTFVKTDASDTDQTVATLWYSPEQMYGKFFISPTGASTTTEVSGSYSEIPVQIPSNLFQFDSEVSDPMAQSMIVVGGPCVNSVAAALLGNPDNCAEGFEQGKAMIKLFDSADGMNAGKVAMLVAGYSGEDTRRAANVLGNYKEYADKLTGKEVVVSGTTSGSVTIGAPEVTTTTEATTTTTEEVTTTTEAPSQ